MIIYNLKLGGQTISEGVSAVSLPSESVFMLLFCFITICILVACLFSIICIYSLSSCVTHQDEDAIDENPIVVPVNEAIPTFLTARDPAAFI